MVRFIRTATLRHSSVVTPAVGYAREITGFLNKKYDINLTLGVEMFGSTNIHWHVDVTDLNTLHELNTKLMMDKEYQSFLDKGKDFWVEGSLLDRVITIVD